MASEYVYQFWNLCVMVVCSYCILVIILYQLGLLFFIISCEIFFIQFHIKLQTFSFSFKFSLCISFCIPYFSRIFEKVKLYRFLQGKVDSLFLVVGGNCIYYRSVFGGKESYHSHEYLIGYLCWYFE